MNAKTALLLIDVQKAFDHPSWGKRNNPQAENNIALILEKWRQQQLPVIHIRHCSVEPNSTLRPSEPGNAYKQEALPITGEIEFTKTVNSAFIGTGLEAYLRENDISALVIVGISTDHCVSTTTRMAANLGFQVQLISDASFTFDRTGADGTTYPAELMHQIHLASLHKEFCQVITTTQLLENVRHS
jgi:nicotinamidase-related amidase